MGRYLTPARVGLLALIELYVEAAVPNDAMMPVLDFVVSHLQVGVAPTESPSDSAPVSWAKVADGMSLISSLDDFESVLGPYSAATEMPGRRLWDVFLAKLWALENIDALQAFFADISKMLAWTKAERRRRVEQGESPPPDDVIRLSRNSPFGMFVRRAALEFLRLPFHHVSELWDDFVRYRHQSFGYWSRKNLALVGDQAFDQVKAEKGLEWKGWDVLPVTRTDWPEQAGTMAAASTDDLEALLEFQVDQMQKCGSRVPLDLQIEFRRILDSAGLVPALNGYLSYLEAWKSGDYHTAFEQLHRYFDYTMQKRDRPFYQYALMNLAVLQADFGCYKEAVDAMFETVTAARENKDNSCLNFALNWLFHFSRNHPQYTMELDANSAIGSGKQSLNYLKIKAKETGMWSLWVSSLLSEAKLNLSSGDSVADAFELLVAASQILLERNAFSMLGAQTSLAASLWERLGQASLSTTGCEVFLCCHAGSVTLDDSLRITCRLAGHLASQGQYDAAFGKLDSIEPNALRSWKANQYWHKYRDIVQARRNLHRNNLSDAESILHKLRQQKPDDLEPELEFTVDHLTIDCFARRGNLDAAFAEVEKLIDLYEKHHKDIAIHIRLILIKASLFDLAGHPERGFSIILRAASSAWRARLLPQLWQALGATANILTARGEFAASVDLLNATIPRVLECEAAFVAGQVYGWLADALMGLAGKEAPKSQKRGELMGRAKDVLEDAFKHYAAVEDVVKQCEVRAKQATVMKVLGDEVRAEEYAAQYLELKSKSGV